jgi:hypothetical protein
MAVVGAVVGRGRETEDPLADPIRQAARARPTPGLPWTTASTPTSTYRRLSRQIDRSLSPRTVATSVTVHSPASSFVSAAARCWSLLDIVIVSLIGGD